MKKITLILAMLLVIALATATFVFATAGQGEVTTTNSETAKPERPVLTDSQKEEVKGIMMQIRELKKQLVDKYESFGAITKEQADKIKEGMDKRTQGAEEKGFLPGSGKFGGHPMKRMYKMRDGDGRCGNCRLNEQLQKE